MSLSAIEIPILFQNSDWLAVDKPYGISVHNAEDSSNLLLQLQMQLKLLKLFPVHRLDKETSGVQILAINSQRAQKWAELFQNRSVEKKYVAILRGGLNSPRGLWDTPLSDRAEGRKNPQGLKADRVKCLTEYVVQESTPYFSHCQFNLLTGRMHQIRKHCALAKHAILGDPRYGDKAYNSRMAKIYQTERMYLHCESIMIDGVRLLAPVPDDFEKVMKQSRTRS